MTGPFPPRRRRVGLVFRDCALFPNLDGRDKLRIALPDKRDERCVTVLAIEPRDVARMRSILVGPRIV